MTLSARVMDIEWISPETKVVSQLKSGGISASPYEISASYFSPQPNADGDNFCRRACE